MLNIPGPPSPDGMSRRTWLQIGGLALGGLSLPDILRAQAKSGTRNPAKGIIMVLLPGGPTHLDTFDPKPDAPAEIRGEFRPIAGNVPGIAICAVIFADSSPLSVAQVWPPRMPALLARIIFRDPALFGVHGNWVNYDPYFTHVR